MCDTGLTILKGRKRHHYHSFRGRLNAIWQVQTDPNPPSLAFVLPLGANPVRRTIQVPQALDVQVGPLAVVFCLVDLAGRS